jgi:putative addiction module antidote
VKEQKSKGGIIPFRGRGAPLVCVEKITNGGRAEQVLGVLPLPRARAGYYICNNSGGGAVVELKVRKFGNSLGVVLPKEVIQRLRTANGEALFLIEAPDGGYQLTPYDPAFEKRMEKANDIINRYRNTLRVLAK